MGHPLRLKSSLFVTACGLLATALLAAQGDFPKPTGRVNDFAGVLDASVEGEIDQLLAELERKTTSEVAVAVVKSLDGMSVEEYANRMFKAWGVGQAKQDNGVLVLVAPTEREMRIEVGYGLEGVLPDGLAGQIIREQFTPRFREDDYSGGIRDGVRRVVEVVERHQVLTPEELARFNEETGDASPAVVIPFLGLFVAIGFFMIGGGIRTKAGFPVLFGSLFGGLPLLISLAISFMLALFTLYPLAAAMFVWGYRMGARESVRNSMRSGKSGSGWVMGTSDSSSSDSDSGSSSSSSSDSFGGGSSGGGGASGRW
jgi:uncharacterized protein